MYLGFVVSLLLHAAVVGWALLSFHMTKELPAPEIPMIEATLVTPDELTRLKMGDPNAKVLEAKEQEKPNPDKAEKEAPKPKKVAALPPPSAEPPPAPEEKPPEPPKPEPAKPEPPKPDPIADKLKEPPPPEPTPGPTPDEQKKLEEKLEQERKAEEQKKAEEKRKAEEKKKAEEARKRAAELKKKADEKRKAEEKKKFDANKLAALLNKIPDSAAAPPTASTPPTKPTTNTGPAAGERQGNDTVLTASEIAMIGSLIKQHIKANDCWHFQAGAVGAEDLKVKLELRFQPDGRLAAEPRVANSSANPQFGFAAESAIRAVKACEPFNMLPAEKYASIWKHMYFTFDPSSLF